MEGSTLSQGIFFQKPKSSGKKKLGRRMECEILESFGTPVETAKQRYEALQRHWEHVNETVQELESGWHANLVEDITSFIEKNSSSMFESELVTPIGFLQTGLSADENMNLFDSIKNAIKDGVSPYVARLKSTMCPNVKTAFQNICKQLIQNNTDVSRFHDTGLSKLEDTFCSETESEQMHSNSRYLSMHDLQQWYESKHPKYFKNQLMKNSPAFVSKVPRVQIKRLDSNWTVISEGGSPSSPATPSRKLLPRSRKSLFGSRNENENLETSIPVKRQKEEQVEFEKKDIVYSTPKRSERVARSSAQKKAINAEESPKVSTPILPSKRVSRRCFVHPDSPENREPSLSTMPSPILRNTESNATPKRLSIVAREFEKLHTPKRINTPGYRTPKMATTDLGLLPIVLIIDDVDYFSPTVVQQIFQLLSCAKLPLIVLVGVINCYESFSRFVPQQCSTTLMYQTFSTVSASKRLNDFFDHVMYNTEFPLILDGKIVEYLSDYFLMYHFSITRLLQAYKLCLLDFYSLPKSLLCVRIRNLQEVLDDVSPENLLETMKATNINVSTFSNDKNLRTPAKKGSSIPSNSIKTDVYQIGEQFHNYCVDWFVSLNFLSGLCTRLPESPLGNDMRELYIAAFNGDLFKEYDNEPSCMDKVLQLMEYIQQGEFKSRFEKAKRLILEFLTSHRLKATNFVAELLSRIQEFLDKIENIKEEERKVAEESRNKKSPDGVLKIKTSRSTKEFQRNFKELMDKKSGISVYNNLKKEMIDYTRKFVRIHLQPFPSKSHSEIFVYDNLTYLQQHFSPLPQKKIHSALSSPSKFLQCNCCKGISSGSIEASLPDTSIVYKLFLEKTIKTVDLNELYQSFLSIVEVPSPKRKASNKNRNDKETVYLLRFRQAVAELQHMGFMLRAKRKPDEVTRQVW